MISSEKTAHAFASPTFTFAIQGALLLGGRWALEMRHKHTDMKQWMSLTVFSSTSSKSPIYEKHSSSPASISLMVKIARRGFSMFDSLM